jgi:hypothetical protein
MLNLQYQHNNHTTIPHMRVDPTHWGPPSCEGLLCGCCDCVVYESNPNLIRIAGFLVHVVNSLLMRVDGMSDFTQLARKLKDQFITFENRRIDLINIKSIGINFGFNKKKKKTRTQVSD